ncbi:MAG: trypsin-like peptidase domain-containing protein [Chloroflexota bacterium]|nr:trypsin-like peptidase domain-containing protein [Chloroflexota bacterium]
MLRKVCASMLLALSLSMTFLAQNEAEIYRDVSPSVVSIELARSGLDSARGAGFVIDKIGHILTNAHVVEDARALTVIFHDGHEAQAKLVSMDSQIDLAVIKVDTGRERLNPVDFGDSDELVVGQPVMAIGNPFGLEATLTSGVISGLNRSLELGDRTTMEGAIQTDAMLAPGNSGGPLFNQAGEVIGVSTAGYRGTALGFAIPSNTARQVANRIIFDADASATREALNTTEVHGTANAMIATANAIIAAADERATEATKDDTADEKTATPTETSAAGEGTFSDPTKKGWRWSDGDGRWIGVDHFSRAINDRCQKRDARCKELKPGNEFIGVMVIADCDESRRTRCEFNSRDFEVAGKRGIPYSAEYHFYFDTLGVSLLPEAIMPGSSFRGLVIFEVPRTDDDFRFGWTPSFGQSTLWFAMSDPKTLAATQAAKRRATANARATLQATENARRHATMTDVAATRQAISKVTIQARVTGAALTASAPTSIPTDTPLPTDTDTPVPTDTDTPEPTDTAPAGEIETIEDRKTGIASRSIVNTTIPTPMPYFVSVDSAVNLRSGPGTNHARVGVALPGDSFAVIGYQAGSPYNWLKIRYKGSEAWIAESLTRLSG